MAVKVDGDSNDLGSDIADAEVRDKDRVVHRQALGHCASVCMPHIPLTAVRVDRGNGEGAANAYSLIPPTLNTSTVLQRDRKRDARTLHAAEGDDEVGDGGIHFAMRLSCFAPR